MLNRYLQGRCNAIGYCRGISAHCVCIATREERQVWRTGVFHETVGDGRLGNKGEH